MLTMRLQRVGKKNQPSYRIVLAEKHRAATKKIVELLGHYNPRTKEFGVKNEGRLKYWISQHIELSPTLRNLLITKGMLQGEKVKAWRPKPKPAEASAEAGPKMKPAPAGGVPAKAGIPESAKPTESPASEPPKSEIEPPSTPA